MSAQPRTDPAGPSPSAAERIAHPRERGAALAAAIDPGRGGERAPARSAATPARPVSWRLASFAGRLAEISGGRASSALTLAFHLAWEAQRQGEPIAWIGRRERAFFPPDAADAGVDLDGFVAVWAPDGIGAARAADLLVRSGGFGLVVLDLGASATLPIAALARLAGLALKHRTAVLCLTEKEPGRPSLGPLVAVRAETERVGQPGGRFLCRARIVKDKRFGPGQEYAEICRGPDGLF
jgi:recombination protein RecA